MKVADIVYNGISTLFTGDIRLVEVEYTKKNDGMHLIVYIDKEDGVTLDDCVYVNNLISDKLDELDPTSDQPYYLDISSYGLDKPLKYDWQFKRYKDKKVVVKLYRKIDGRKEFVAVLIGKEDGEVIFNIDKENISINSEDVAYITPYIEF